MDSFGQQKLFIVSNENSENKWIRKIQTKTCGNKNKDIPVFYNITYVIVFSCCDHL